MHGDSLASHDVSFQDLGFYNLITLLTTGFMRPILLVTPPHHQADIDSFVGDPS